MFLKDSKSISENMKEKNVHGRSGNITRNPSKAMSCIRNPITIKNSKVTMCVLLVLLNFAIQDVQAVPCRGGCQNNGMMIMPTSLFGYCRCVCIGPYAGPTCEFKTKRRVKIRKLIKIKGTLKELIQRRMEQKE